MSDAPDEDALSGRKFMRWNVGAALIALVTLAVGAWIPRHPAVADEGQPEADPSGLLRQERWSDGLAEVARYAAWRSIYGKERPYELVRVTVKEPFDPQARVKPDQPRPGVVDAIKTVAVHRIGVPPKPYEYRMTLITRVAPGDPSRLFDASMSSQEWCGNTFVLVRGALPERPWRREARGYFDGQSEREDQLPAGTVLEDQLPLLVRALDLSRGPREVRLLPSLLGNKAPATAPYGALITRVAAAVPVDVPAGRWQADEIVVQPSDGAGPDALPALRYWVARSGERALLRWADRTGQGELTRLERIAYWRDEGR